MSRKLALSRRTFLTGSGVSIALPFLDAMIPTFAGAQTLQPKRFLVALNGSVGGKLGVPSAVGALPAAFPAAYKALESVRQHVSFVSNLGIATYNPNLNQAFIPGGAISGTHGYTRGPMLSGMGSHDGMQIPHACKTSTHPGNQTCDQYAADAFGSATKFRSLQFRVQTVPYNGNTTSSNGSMSARKQNGLVSNLEPMVSPLAIYNLLFSGTSGGGGTTPPPPSTLLSRDKSVLDLVLGDAARLNSSLSGEDRVRMELHFEEIRNIERAIASQISGGGGVVTPTCTSPTNPGPDTPPNKLSFGGWANETLRGQLQADMIAFAFACDISRVVSWMITNDQCWLNSNQTSSSTVAAGANQDPDIHGDSHFAPDATVASNCNWHAALFARLVSNLAAKSDAGGPLLNNTFLSLIACEGANAHSRGGFVSIVAGNPSRIKIGQHINGNGQHPARLQTTGLQSIGVNMNNAIGEVPGVISELIV